MKTISFLVGLLFLLSFPGQTQLKIGIIDPQEILARSGKGIEIQKTFEKWQVQKQEEVNTVQEQVKRLEKELTSPVLGPETREKKDLELQAKRTELKRIMEDAQRYIQNEQQRMLSEFDNQISPIISNYGREKGFTVILDKTRAGIVYFDKAIDITSDLINLVNEQ